MKRLLKSYTNFILSTKTNSPTGNAGVTSFLPIGDFFNYVENVQIKSGSDDIFLVLKKQIFFTLGLLQFITLDSQF